MKDEVTVMEDGSPYLNLRPSDPKVIEAAQRFAARRRDHSVWWRPSPELEDAIIQATLGSWEVPQTVRPTNSALGRSLGS